MQRRWSRRDMTSQHSTSPPTDDPRGIVDPDLVAAFRKLSTLKADYEAKLLDYMEDCLGPVLNAWRVAGGVEPQPPPNRPPVVFEELEALWKEYQALEAWKAELAAAYEDPQPHKSRNRKPRGPNTERVAKLVKKPGVARVEVKPDGGYTVVAGEPSASNTEATEWDEAHHLHTPGASGKSTHRVSSTRLKNLAPRS
jgi:hypothetical protein